jgi:hypothetical protein
MGKLGTEATQCLFGEYLFRIFGIVSFQCICSPEAALAALANRIGADAVIQMIGRTGEIKRAGHLYGWIMGYTSCKDDLFSVCCQSSLL